MADNSKKSIFYIGDDKSYWHTVMSRIRRDFSKLEFNFRHISNSEFEHYQHLFLELITRPPSVLYLDFSLMPDSYLKLANLLKLENSFKHIPIVGLVDKKEKIEACIFAGVDVIHVKCGEFHDVVYDPFKITFPKLVEDPQFAKATFNREVFLITDFRIGYITPTYIHAEGNMELEEGSLIELNTHIPKKLVPSRWYRVKTIDDKNLYYDYKFSYDLEFVFVDEPEDEVAKAQEETEGMDQARVDLAIKQARQNQKIKMAEYESDLYKSKKDTRQWVEENMGEAGAKMTKIMILDTKLDFLKNTQKNLDEHPFTTRLQTKFSENYHEIYTLRPDIIATQFYDPAALTVKLEEEFNTFTHQDGTPLTDDEITVEKEKYLDNLKKNAEGEALDLLSDLVKKIKTFEGYRPYIIVFQCSHYESKTIQESLKYPFIISNAGPLYLRHVVHMAEAYEKRNNQKFLDHVHKKIAELKAKDPRKYRNISEFDFKEKRYYISRKDALSRANFRHKIQLQSMTESSCTFYCEKNLSLDTYRLDFPVDLSLTLIPLDETKDKEKSGDGYIYNGLIHSVGELEKREVRKFVNEIFFSDLNSKRQEEQEAFKKLNKKALEDKLKTSDAADEQISDEQIDDSEDEAAN